jgi:hypothetical protein
MKFKCECQREGKQQGGGEGGGGGMTHTFVGKCDLQETSQCFSHLKRRYTLLSFSAQKRKEGMGGTIVAARSAGAQSPCPAAPASEPAMALHGLWCFKMYANEGHLQRSTCCRQVSGRDERVRVAEQHVGGQRASSGGHFSHECLGGELSHFGRESSACSEEGFCPGQTEKFTAQPSESAGIFTCVLSLSRTPMKEPTIFLGGGGGGVWFASAVSKKLRRRKPTDNECFK